MNTKLTRSVRSTSIAMVSIALTLSTLMSIANSQTGNAGNDSWTPLGLYGVRIVDVAIDPHDNQTIYAGTSGPGGLYKSTDAGSTWTSILPGTWDWYEKILFDPRDSNTIYINTYDFYRSTDGGVTWHQIPRFGQFLAAAINPIDGTLYASIDVSTNPGMTNDFGIFRSIDGGDNWERLTQVSFQESIHVIVVAPSAPHIIYAAGGSGIFRSDDRGDTWLSIDSSFGAPPEVYSLAVDTHDAQVVYLGTAENSIFRSTDGGESWIPIGNGLSTNCIRTIQIDPGNQQIIYIGGGTPNFSSSNSGTPGVYKSLDNTGNSWTPMMTGMGSRSILSLELDNNLQLTIYAGTDGSGVWKYSVVSGSEDYSISINNGALFTNQITVTLTLTAPLGTTDTQISNDGGFAGANWEPFTRSKPWTITAYGSYVLPRIVYAKFKTDGIVSGVYQDDIILDQTAPTGTIQIINPIASTGTILPKASVYSPSTLSATASNTVYLPLVSKNNFTGFRLVGLSLTAIDDVSGVDGMLISNDPAFTGAQWQAYAQKLNWYVNKEGMTTVYIKYRDRASNESPVYSATTAAP